MTTPIPPPGAMSFIVWSQFYSRIQQLLWGDELAVQLPFDPSNITQIENGQLIISLKDLRKRIENQIKEEGDGPIISHNLKILLDDESSDFISLDAFSRFISRFGPILRMKAKIDLFIKQGAGDWYHGNITSSEAINILKSHHPTSSKKFLYLYRNNTQQEITEGSISPTVCYAFALTWLQCGVGVEENVAHHFRIYVTQDHCLGYLQFDEQNIPRFVTVPEWNFRKILETVVNYLQIPLDSFQPVSCPKYYGLQKDNTDYLRLLPKPKNEEPTHFTLKPIPGNNDYFSFSSTMALDTETLV